VEKGGIIPRSRVAHFHFRSRRDQKMRHVYVCNFHFHHDGIAYERTDAPSSPHLSLLPSTPRHHPTTPFYLGKSAPVQKGGTIGPEPLVLLQRKRYATG
jgi:hypothetical protein